MKEEVRRVLTLAGHVFGLRKLSQDDLARKRAERMARDFHLLVAMLTSPSS